jgi:cleavage and polyadenylation specificity factor subunit 3
MDGQILVHGEVHNMMKLKSRLMSLNANKTNKVKVYSPRNTEELRIPFKTDKTAKVVGKLATINPPAQSSDGKQSADQVLTGVLVQNDFKMSLMAPEDLREYAGLTTTTVICKQRIRLSAAGIDLIKWGLEGMFGTVEEINAKQAAQNGNGEHAKSENGDTVMNNGISNDILATYLVMSSITVRCHASGEIELEWEGNMQNDSLADFVMTCLLSVESSPAAVKRSAAAHKHEHFDPADDVDDEMVLPKRNLHANLSPEEKLERLFMFLEAQFGSENVEPVADPKLPELDGGEVGENGKTKKEGQDGEDSDASMELSDEESNTRKAAERERNLEKRREAEIERLHLLGIPVPGVEIRVDKMRAKVWLEDLSIECDNKVLAARVKAVLEAAVRTVAPLADA